MLGDFPMKQQPGEWLNDQMVRQKLRARRSSSSRPSPHAQFPVLRFQPAGVFRPCFLAASRKEATSNYVSGEKRGEAAPKKKKSASAKERAAVLLLCV